MNRLSDSIIHCVHSKPNGYQSRQTRRSGHLQEGDCGTPLTLNVESCTLCHSCVNACPTGALSDNPDRAMLRFTESICVQCGLCEATCPEDAITLQPRLDFQAWEAPQRVLKEEDPFHCIGCDKPFGTKSTIERVVATLEEKHWMFTGANAQRIDVVKMCEDCRVEAVVNESFDPHAVPRPPTMTAEDYLPTREASKGDPIRQP